MKNQCNKRKALFLPSSEHGDLFVWFSCGVAFKPEDAGDVHPVFSRKEVHLMVQEMLGCLRFTVPTFQSRVVLSQSTTL